MKYIDKNRINDIISKSREDNGLDIDVILNKSRALKRLTLEETAALLCVRDEKDLKKIFEAATYVKNTIYGKRVVLFAPLYINNICINFCQYCAFKADNQVIKRKKLSQEEISAQTVELLKMGHKRVLVVASESSNESDIDFYCQSIKTIYDTKYQNHNIRRININCAPLNVPAFQKLKAIGIGTYQLFQETYHDTTYIRVHPDGPKSDPDNRLNALDRAFKAGIDDVGVGVLYGLYDYVYETLALLMHVEHLEKMHGVGPHTISVPRLEPAIGVDLERFEEYRVSDSDFMKLVAVLRLSVPYTGLILSTRETPEMRDMLFNLGVSQISAASKTSPGGYSDNDETQEDTQFCLSDHRSLNDIIRALVDDKMIPSFCTACYRAERTGKAFMDLAKPGTIKGKCNINALITLKEYLDDFATDDVKETGYKLINDMIESYDETTQKSLKGIMTSLDKGERDTYI
ncbi:MAG: [FeFe] hydrogenase H-cluster radical SAM maturase HydG [Candidatus Ancaeobacter aquaticus]|nr:[FeFe] hydrogenase H-cluster radical SAM maturase HydG [Candidatus Ancaeobacter aquaticus]